jgi:putative ABC transport system substrate-binding protein
MDRRQFVLAALAGVLSRDAAAQPAAKVYRIGTLDYAPETGRPAWWKAFRGRLRELGYVEGKNLGIASRFADGSQERLRPLADQLVELKPDVLVTSGTLAAVAAKQATATIPIVTATGADFVRLGLVASLARPGANLTGVTSISSELAAKRLELIKAFAPAGARVAVLIDERNPSSQIGAKRIEAAAGEFGMRAFTRGLRDPAGFDAVFKSTRDEGADVVVIGNSASIFPHRKQLAELALRHRLPTITGWREFAEAGLLMSYGTDYQDLFRRAAEYVDRVLKGAKPAALPVEQPSKFELVINLKTAKALGLTIPPALVFRADHLIQ